MKKVIVAVVGCVIVSATCLAEPFQLKDDKTGTLYGPFEFKDGSKIVVGTTSFTLVKPKRTESTVEKKMQEIKIPEIDFRQANIRDVVQFLQDASVQFDKTDAAQGEKGVNMILNLQATDAPLVTFNARAISLFEAIKIVTQVANLTYRIDGNVVMIEAKK